jgi:hypothetical protein
MGGLGVLGHVLMLGLVVVVGVTIAVVSVFVADRVLGESVGPQHNSTLSPFMTVVGLVFGALPHRPRKVMAVQAVVRGNARSR